MLAVAVAFAELSSIGSLPPERDRTETYVEIACCESALCAVRGWLRSRGRAPCRSLLLHRTAHGHAVQDHRLRAGRGSCEQGGEGGVCADRRARWYHERLSPRQRI